MTVLQEILGSKSKIELLEKILESNDSFSVRELSRMSGLPKSTVALIVEEWQKASLLSSQAIGKTKMVKVNKKFSLYSTLKKLFSSNKKAMEQTIKQIKTSRLLASKEVVCAIVFGSLAKKKISSQSDADILIITKKPVSGNSPLNKLWQSLYSRISLLPSPVFLTEKQVLGRLKENDHFINNVFKHGIALKGGSWFDATKRTFRNSIRTV